MNAWLVLETGEVYSGLWHSGKDRAGEVVFNTSHSGYEEIATDPSYFGQIVCLTAPMMGNYGVDQNVWESRRLWIEGFICLQVQDSDRDRSWIKRLDEDGIPLVSCLDTRGLVLRLRSGGTPWGALVQAETEAEAREKAAPLIAAKKTIDKDWVAAVSRREVEVRPGRRADGPRLAVLDFGSKENILRELENHASELRLYPSRASARDILASQPDGIMLTNGPGDPADVRVATETVRELIGKKPIFGICMGHQILGLALGGKTYKMKFGHRGSNHPIKDDLLGRIYMTSQNHGYAVDRATLPEDVRVTHVNLNDQTVAGIYSEKRRCLGIQYHPESCPGPHDARDLFRFFTEKMT
ncbi:MAG: glutamine-hydrolyzing carbamoyl-phosphate synthase small subunit [Bdellovibrionaceae bacterium]|nr:glutamine-hydrolyzing carbamoyl-phosphate synthase small subunit [Pseudobdellovibrionaceae bacterium]MBX3035015.1 glutamine-hydrolyzing carbamoyl-phosphate synthase small subunit [Pseudobdellovibrionaceae bacterium]